MAKQIRNLRNYWESMNEVDRGSLMESIYINKEIGILEFSKIPNHLRAMLYSLWNKKWRHQKNEINF